MKTAAQIEALSLERLVKLNNKMADPWEAPFYYIQENEPEILDGLAPVWGGYLLACAIEAGRFREDDKYIVATDDPRRLVTFSDKETFFREFISADQLAEAWNERFC